MRKDMVNLNKKYLLTSTYPKDGNTVVWKKVESKVDKYHVIYIEQARVNNRVTFFTVDITYNERSLSEIYEQGWGTKRGHIIKDYDTFDELVADNLDMFL